MCIKTNSRTTFFIFALAFTSFSFNAGGQSPTPQQDPLDINDVSFLWPVPTTKAEVDALISLNDAAIEGKIFPDDLWAKLIDEAKTVNVGRSRISFPNDAVFKKPITWKVAGIRVNPSALGTNPEALLQLGVVPSLRLIVQPVTVEGDGFKIHDFAAHVVLTQTKAPTNPNKPFPFQPNNDAFNAIIKDLREIKTFLDRAGVKTAQRELDVHPGFRVAAGKPNEVPGFSGKLRALLKEHWNNKQLVISFMGIPSENEPWIFFKVTLANGRFRRDTVSGHFGPPPPKSQMLSFLSGAPKVEPAPVPNAAAAAQGFGVGTDLLFRADIESHLDDPLFPGSPDASAKQLKLRDVPDFIANPSLRNTANTDCVSCHTETTLRHSLGLTPQPLAFKHPAGISKVAASVLPTDKWNVRDFGWGLNFFNNREFKPTVTQRAANEAAESADLINKGPLVVPVPQQPVASANFNHPNLPP